MKFGTHLPQCDFETSRIWRPGELRVFTEVARDASYDTIASNDHLIFQRSWLDGLIALASVIEHSGDLALTMSISLPVIRGPVALAKAAATIDVLSGGRLNLGVGPGSSARDYEAVGISWEERWPRFDEALRVLETHLKGGEAFEGRFYSSTNVTLTPPPEHPLPLWIGSWGSDAGLRRVARRGDAWLASAYNITPPALAEAKTKLTSYLERYGKDAASFPCTLSTNYTYITEDRAEQRRLQETVATMANRPIEQVQERSLIGPAEEVAAKLRAYSDAGVGEAFLWFVEDDLTQIEHFQRRVKPLVNGG